MNGKLPAHGFFPLNGHVEALRRKTFERLSIPFANGFLKQASAAVCFPLLIPLILLVSSCSSEADNEFRSGVFYHRSGDSIRIERYENYQLEITERDTGTDTIRLIIDWVDNHTYYLRKESEDASGGSSLGRLKIELLERQGNKFIIGGSFDIAPGVVIGDTLIRVGDVVR